MQTRSISERDGKKKNCLPLKEIYKDNKKKSMVSSVTANHVYKLQFGEKTRSVLIQHLS